MKGKKEYEMEIFLGCVVVKAGRRPACIPKPELVCAAANTAAVNDRPGSVCCTKEIVRMANTTVKEHKVLSSALESCPIERCL